MKKRYFYVVASFMRKDVANTWRKVDFTIMKDDGSALFPLMEAIKAINEGYSEIADPCYYPVRHLHRNQQGRLCSFQQAQ